MKRGAWMILVLLFLSLSPGCDSGDPVLYSDAPGIVSENNRGVALMGRFDFASSEQVFAGILEEHPALVDVRVNLAIATLNRQLPGDEEAAVTVLESVLADESGHRAARYCLSLLQFRAGREAEAGNGFASVARADPTDAYAAYFAGQAAEVTDLDEAEAWYAEAMARDPSLRSAAYRRFQVLQRLGKMDESRAYFTIFQALEDSPQARTVEWKYTRTGRYAEAILFGTRDLPGDSQPDGPWFDAPQPLIVDGGEEGIGGGSRSITAAPLGPSGIMGLFLAGAGPGGQGNVVLYPGDGPAAFPMHIQADHPLAGIEDVEAALWGDYDNDGLVDVYLCRVGPNMLLRQLPAGDWLDVTEATGTDAGDHETAGGLFLDGDHDGDLDLICFHRDGGVDFFGNNLDGSFRHFRDDQGPSVRPGTVYRQVLVTDIDRDRDTDILLLDAEGHLSVHLNDRLWSYDRDPRYEDLESQAMRCAWAGDIDADGQVDVVWVDDTGSLYRGHLDAGVLVRRRLGPETYDSEDPALSLCVVDVDGDMGLDVLVTGSHGVHAVNPVTGDLHEITSVPAARSWAPVLLHPGRGYALVMHPTGAMPMVYPAGPGRFEFAEVALSGGDAAGSSTRSNASGIGTRITSRIQGRFVVVETGDECTAPGQSLQPVALGLAGAAGIEYLAIDWSDGVFQSEAGLDAGAHRVVETQRQLSSCPILLAWDGTGFGFVSDLLGVGGLGYLLEPGVYSTPRPRENFMLPRGIPTARGGDLLLRLSEPMEEACYLDTASLVSLDIPPGWQAVLDERLAIGGPSPTGEARFFRHEEQPLAAVNDRGEDVRSSVMYADLRAAPPGRLDHRFIGRLAGEHLLELTFAGPLEGAGSPMLVIDGWVEYPYSQTMFAAWQAGAGYQAPSIEAGGEGMEWTLLIEEFGYPAGMPRRMSVPLPPLPPGTSKLRLRTNMEIYWDRIAVAFAEPCPGARAQELDLLGARLLAPGFPDRTTRGQRVPVYDTRQRVPFDDIRALAGTYTTLGPVADLVHLADGAMVIFGPGEELEMRWREPGSPPGAGWGRRYIFQARGWCKDMDLFTRDGETLEPLPGREDAGEHAAALNRRFNVRYRSGT